MSELIYHMHYKLRKKINFFLLHTLYRSQYNKMKDNPYIPILAYSKAILDFSLVEPSQGILSKSELLDSGSTVIDVGGDVGSYSEKIYEKYMSNIYIFEPHPDSVKVLKEKFTNKKIKIFNYGLGSKDQIVQLSSRGMGSSIYGTSPGFDESDKFEIDIRDVKNVFSELSFDEIDLIKINIEGGEYDLVPRMIESGIIKKCKIIRIQFHDWIPNAFAKRKEIVKQLSKTHDIEWSYPMVWESWIRKDITNKVFNK